MAVAVTDADVGLEAGALTGRSLLLHWHDLQDVIVELASREEQVDNLELLDRKRVQ